MSSSRLRGVSEDSSVAPELVLPVSSTVCVALSSSYGLVASKASASTHSPSSHSSSSMVSYSSSGSSSSISVSLSDSSTGFVTSSGRIVSSLQG